MFFVPMISGVTSGPGSVVARPVESAHADSSPWASPSRRQQPCWVSSRWPFGPVPLGGRRAEPHRARVRDGLPDDPGCSARPVPERVRGAGVGRRRDAPGHQRRDRVGRGAYRHWLRDGPCAHQPGPHRARLPALGLAPRGDRRPFARYVAVGVAIAAPLRRSRRHQDASRTLRAGLRRHRPHHLSPAIGKMGAGREPMRCVLPTRTAGSEASAPLQSVHERRSRRSTPGGVARPRAALHAIALITTLDSGVATAAVTAALVRLLSQRHDPELQAGGRPAGPGRERLRTYPASRFRVIGASLGPGRRGRPGRGPRPPPRHDASPDRLDPVQRKVLAAWASTTSPSTRALGAVGSGGIGCGTGGPAMDPDGRGGPAPVRRGRARPGGPARPGACRGRRPAPPGLVVAGCSRGCDRGGDRSRRVSPR